jgi:integrase
MPVKASADIQELREAIASEIRSKRPKLAESSLKTYCNGLTNLYQRLQGHGGLSWFTDAHEDIMAHVQKIESVQTRKTLLASLVVLTGLEAYREPMMADIKTQNDHYLQQKTSPKRSDRLISYERVREIHENLKLVAKVRPSLTNIVNLIISYVCSGVLGLPPRRLEYASMLMSEWDPKKDNYIDWRAKSFVFNQYKTARVSGREVIPIPSELFSLLQRWKKTNESLYMLINNRGQPFQPSSLSKRVSELFEGNGIDSLRSIFLSHVYRNMPALKDMQNLARSMGHSVDAALHFYVKRDGDDAEANKG